MVIGLNSRNINYAYELDTIAHPIDKSSYQSPIDEQIAVLKEIDRKGKWIMEGTDRRYQRCLFEWADLIIYLDPPINLRKRRIMTRYIKQITGIERCRYKPTLKMLKMMYQWTANYEKKREGFEAFLSQFGEKVYHITEPFQGALNNR